MDIAWPAVAAAAAFLVFGVVIWTKAEAIAPAMREKQTRTWGEANARDLTPGRLRAAAAGAIVLTVVALVFAFTSGGGDAETGGGEAETGAGLTVHWPSVIPALALMAVIVTVLLVRRRRSKR